MGAEESQYQPDPPVTTPITTTRRLVRVWFGAHVIAAHAAEPALAQRYAEAMARRFYGLRVTTEPLHAGSAASLPDLPAEPLWPLTAK